MKILVTGAAGFIGSAVCRSLLDRGDNVTGLDNINGYYDPALKYGRLVRLGVKQNDVAWYKFTQSTTEERFRFVRMNLEDTHAMQMLFANEGFDAVVNLGAQPGDVYRTFADSSALAKATGFKPGTPLQEGINRTVAWFREYYHL